jgi:hypothetical protein
MKFHEKESEQRTIILLGTAVFVAGFLVIAIDLRLHDLNQVSTFIVLAADAGVLLGYCLILWVFKENSYASRAIEVLDVKKSSLRVRIPLFATLYTWVSWSCICSHQ